MVKDPAFTSGVSIPIPHSTFLRELSDNIHVLYAIFSSTSTFLRALVWFSKPLGKRNKV